MAHLSDQGQTHATMTTPVTNPHRSAAPSEYTPISVGHCPFAVMIQTLVAPPIQAAIPDKAMALDFLFHQLRTAPSPRHCRDGPYYRPV
jgi:hypothetical protein